MPVSNVIIALAGVDYGVVAVVVNEVIARARLDCDFSAAAVVGDIPIAAVLNGVAATRPVQKHIGLDVVNIRHKIHSLKIFNILTDPHLQIKLLGKFLMEI